MMLRVLKHFFLVLVPVKKRWIYEQKIMRRIAPAGVAWQCGFFFNFRDQLHVGDCSWARSRANMRARKWSREKFVGAAVST